MVVVQGEAGIGKSRLTKLTAADEKRIAALVKRAVS